MRKVRGRLKYNTMYEPLTKNICYKKMERNAWLVMTITYRCHKHIKENETTWWLTIEMLRARVEMWECESKCENVSRKV